jgi:hypothetical protein
MSLHFRLAVGSMVLALVHVPAVVRGQAYCQNNAPHYTTMPIKWQLNQAFVGTDSLCDHSNCTLTGVRRTIEASLAQFYNSTSGTVRFKYEGTTSESAGATISGHVHIYPIKECPQSQGGIALFPLSSPPAWGKIGICRANEAKGIIEWNSFIGEGLDGDGYGEGVGSFQKFILHEMGHLLGLGHPDACAAPDASMMQPGNGPNPHMLFPEIEFIHDHYGPRASAAKLMWGDDALSWTLTNSSPPSNMGNTMGRFAATNSRSGSHMFMSFVGREWWRPVNVSRFDGSTWTHRSSFTTWNSHSHAGIASSSNTNVFVSYPAGYELDTGKHGVWFRMSSDAAASWTSPTELSSTAASRTTNPGVSSTYDPDRERYITVWRQSSGFVGGLHGNYIRYRTVPNGALRSLQGLFAADTPSIACGDKTVVGDYNCLLAWTNALSWSRPVLWTQCRLVGSQFNELDCLSPKSHGYVSYGSPSVAYSSNGAYPWQIALNQGSTATYTWRKGPYYSHNFQDQRSFGFGPQSVFPASGSRNLSSGRRYVLTANH